jgi:PiT family inorganic phosphate transporter
MEIIATYGFILMALAIVFGLYMTWGIGANDVANAMGTSVGSGAITVKQAILIAAIFEFAGAFIAGGNVTKTIRKGIIDPSSIVNSPEILVFGMLAALLAAAVWLMIASSKGWPVSTTHSIVGAVIGFAVVGIGVDAVQWGKVGQIAASWLVSPLLGGTIAFLLMMSIRRLILNTENPFQSAKRWGPAYIFLVGFIISLVTLFKGLKHLNIELSVGMSFLVAVIFCAMAFAHGSNDVANGIGPLAAVVSIIQSGGEVTQKADLPLWILVLGGTGIVVGLATMGYRVMQTIGSGITQLTPSRGYCATLAAAATVVLASRTGLPVSTTHIAVGAVIGVGLARGVGAIDLRVIGNIVVSWVVTLPVGAALSALFFFTLKGMFT